MKIGFIILLLQVWCAWPAHTQQIKLPSTFRQGHPRLQVDKEDAVRTAFGQLKSAIDPYVTRCEADSTWLLSRLQLYWKTRSTEVYIKGGVYDHAEGEAPVPTVRFPGSRDNVTIYGAPKLEDMLPYADDPRGVYLVNRSKPGQPLEWAEISKTGRTIEGINTMIMGMAHNAALLYWITGDEKYARFAFPVFDTYMTGMYYRNTPKDLTHGHHETIAGLSTFEVIQETALLNHLTGIYDFLYAYLQQKGAAKMQVYTTVLRKWADVQIEHGVAFNNWDLIEARNILSIGSVLEDNTQYPDGKGRQYYINFVLNRNAERQWSIARLLKEGYDDSTGLWNECPGYSMNVLSDFTELVTLFDRQYNHDILPDIPVLKKAVLASAQYLFPNGYHTAFGDSYYGRLSTNGALQLVANAQHHHKAEQEVIYTRYIKTINGLNERTGLQTTAGNSVQTGRKEGPGALLARGGNTVLKDDIVAGTLEEYVTPVFSAPHVSYFALRNGFHPQDGLMVAMSGSKGNHMHAGGIAMEIFGKGMILGPESGIGTSYFQQDYAEYYSQFPAHNTVAVDGISAYPVMKSNHGFDVKSSYPASGVTTGFFSRVSFGDLYFVEPETQSDQDRLTSIIRTSDSTGYYVDIFRSRRRDGKDKMHDYFYHNMGQQLTVSQAGGKPLDMQPTQQLSFGGGHLFAYDYFWDKKAVTTNKDVQAVFNLSVPGKEAVQMNMWMKGEKDRELFAVKAPKAKAIERMGLPSEIATLPLPTIVARQNGEAWNKPFVVVFEPSTTTQPVSVQSIQSFHPASAPPGFVGLEITGRAGDKQMVFADAAGKKIVTHKDLSCTGTYGVVSENSNGLQYLFLGHGTKISKGSYSITTKTAGTAAALCHESGAWYVTASHPVTITVPQEMLAGKTTIRITMRKKTNTIYGKPRSIAGKKVIAFDIPAMPYTKIEL
jgi:hypothetical protein